MAEDIKITSYSDPDRKKDYVIAEMAHDLMARQLQKFAMHDVLSHIEAVAVKTIIKEHGEEILNIVIAKEDDIKNRVIEGICKNIEWFAHELMMLERDFNNRELCKCGQVHGNFSPSITTEGLPGLFAHSFEPMTNLQYLEHRYARVKTWVKSLDI